MTYRTRRRPGHLGRHRTSRHHWRPGSGAKVNRRPLTLQPRPMPAPAVRADYLLGAVAFAITAAVVALVAMWAFA